MYMLNPDPLESKTLQGCPRLNARFIVLAKQKGYVGYTRGHLHNRLKGHKQQSSAIAKHYKNVHGTIHWDLLTKR